MVVLEVEVELDCVVAHCCFIWWLQLGRGLWELIEVVLRVRLG